MKIKELNETISKFLEEYGEDAELNWADDYEELDSTDYRSMYLCRIGDKYCIAVVEYNQAGDADFCDRSNLFNSKEDALKFYKENLSSFLLDESLYITDETFSIGQIVYSKWLNRYGKILEINGDKATVDFICTDNSTDSAFTRKDTLDLYKLEDGISRLDSIIATKEHDLQVQKDIKELLLKS